MKKQTKVIHLEINGQHHFFSSLKAMCSHFGEDQLGLDYNAIRALDVSPGHPYTDAQRGYIIREGVLEVAEKVKK